MNKTELIRKFTYPLIILGVFLASYAYAPILRFLIGLDTEIAMPFSTALIFLIAGYMAALAGLIAWAKELARNNISHNNNQATLTIKPHLLGLSLMIPVPFISCILLLYLWNKDRQLSHGLDNHYRHTINFHLSLHLYFLLSFFLTPVAIGFLMLFALLAVYIAATLFRLIKAGNGHYPLNIQIISILKN